MTHLKRCGIHVAPALLRLHKRRTQQRQEPDKETPTRRQRWIDRCVVKMLRSRCRPLRKTSHSYVRALGGMFAQSQMYKTTLARFDFRWSLSRAREKKKEGKRVSPQQ